MAMQPGVSCVLAEIRRHKDEIWAKLVEECDVETGTMCWGLVWEVRDALGEPRGCTCFATNPGMAARTPNLRAA